MMFPSTGGGHVVGKVRQSEQQTCDVLQVVRGAVVLPHGTGKPVRIAVFARGADAELARAEGEQSQHTESVRQVLSDNRRSLVQKSRGCRNTGSVL